MNRKNKTVTVALQRKTLLYDISLKAFLLSDTIKDDKEKAAKLSEVTREDRIARVNAWLNEAFNNLKSAASEYTGVYDETATSEADSLMTSADSYAITLNMPYCFPKSLSVDMTKAAHDYMVNYTLSCWLTMFYPDMVKPSTDEATLNLTAWSNDLTIRVAPDYI